MDRRRFLLATLGTPLVVAARPKDAGPRRIGFVLVSPPRHELDPASPVDDAVRLMIEGMRRLGWHEGRDIQTFWRSAEGDYERLGPILDELVAMPVDVLVVHGRALDAATARTTTIPIVIAATGLASTLRSDGTAAFPTNVTGTTLEGGSETVAKRIELLRAMVPSASVLARAFDQRLGAWREDPASRHLAQLPFARTIFAPYDLDRPEKGLDAALQQGAQVVLFHASPGTQRRERQSLLAQWTQRRRVPAIHSNFNFAENGGLMAFGADIPAIFRRTPYFVDKILRGARPSELPLEQPAVTRLVVNLDAARAIGLKVPGEVLLRADQVIGQPVT